MNTLSSDARLPLYQRLRDQLIEQIANNRWRPGEAIPTEAVLSAEYALSTGTVRKAVDALVSEGILERQQGRGTFVRRPQFQSSLFRFFRFQGPSGERQVPQSRILTVESVAAPSAVSEALGLAPEAQVIRIVRTRLFDVQPLLAEEIWLPRARFQALLDIDLAVQGPLLYPVYESVCGQVVASAEETLTAESVNAVYARLLQVPVNSPVVVIERLARDYAGQPLEWRRSRGHAEHFRYRVDIR
ncbi:MULTISPECIES: GntR family transcriptional regulator [unclassified Pseudomonas]|uniref:GntR family transcriptional regulator n=1 Tax=unclassified Pseudomonas TaxID=196821 RepID=UPI000C86BEA3|nr:MULTISPECIES: GntR family transcriptional regulator [unclassified Pseudomonas]PMV18298.1 GntR family transcriptional regulator [Pseudomonas sp. FW305-3-2-15-C-TSA2]PMV28762.1 GntR family transcriptional regulator [Pseudomonas sp. DP16D-L5]PMV36548.1 GntR family transcriptional regulator [Pseudomonas sp. FW305-3-2-15-A-LB2]PMV48965.1 GntR family transcriptional regulator [Pseudomonas sp. FW305-3-2-15-C-R2A1]PMV53419.1 GntR family transcriptional regulator [Pseudomonas sp. FW305-3-2-15-C-LB1]